ncbi:MAG TPA: DUF4440 domain-containing protein [Rhizomicrobium sp.]
MPKSISCFVALLALGAATHADARPATVDERAQFVSVETEWLNDIVRHDGYALFRLLAQDFTQVSWDGTVTNKKGAIDAALKSTSREQRLDGMDVNIFNDTTVVVTGTTHVSDGDGDVAMRFTDVFVRRDGFWQAVSAQETLIQKP